MAARQARRRLAAARPSWVASRQAAPVHRVGHRPAAEREDEDGHELDEGQQPDRERIPGHDVELVWQRHDCDLPPGFR